MLQPSMSCAVRERRDCGSAVRARFQMSCAVRETNDYLSAVRARFQIVANRMATREWVTAIAVNIIGGQGLAGFPEEEYV